MHFYLARQPVFDSTLKVVAYELLYRSGDGQAKLDPELDNDAAVSSVVIQSVMNLGLTHVTGGAPALINVSRSLLLDQSISSLLSKGFILEILETTIVDDKLIQRVRHLKKEGFRFALDDFVYSPQWEALIALSDIIKIDVLAMNFEQIEQTLSSLKHFKGKLLAEKVEDYSAYERCKALGFDYFQGYFMARPKMLEERNITAKKLPVCQVLSFLSNDKQDHRDLLVLLEKDIQLSANILRLLNTSVDPVHGVLVSSVNHAIAEHGLKKVVRLASLLSLTQQTNKPEELLAQAWLRSTMCQLLAKSTGQDGHKAFAVGLLSLFEALMDIPMVSLFEKMPFCDDIVISVRELSGDLGGILKTVLCYEAGDWDGIVLPDSVDLLDIYLKALHFSELIKLID